MLRNRKSGKSDQQEDPTNEVVLEGTIVFLDEVCARRDEPMPINNR